MAAHDAVTGVRQAAALRQGRIEYTEYGSGQAVVFVHGLFVNSALWRGVAPVVAAAGFRCIVPDWPFGAHRLAMPANATLDPPAVGTLLCGFLDALDLRDVVLVANDTGCAYSQLAITQDAHRIGALVLTPGDSLDRFFPPMFRFLQVFARIPGSTYLLAQTLRVRSLHRLPWVFGLLSKRPVPEEVMAAYLAPMRRDSAVRRDLGKILRGVDKKYTMAAATKFPAFDRPVLLAWAPEDKLFPISLAEHMGALFPNARVEQIEDSYTFVPEDQPGQLAELIIGVGRNLAPEPPAADGNTT
jgi:pimeloyl-ACP methyl ester carboxylesterase